MGSGIRTASHSMAEVAMRNAIPTEYGGVRFRSRLEAQWAAFFDLLGWGWEYEPFDLSGYIPDFVIPSAGAEDGQAKSVVVDVKPILTLREMAFRGSELLPCGWNGSIIVVGAALPRSWDGLLQLGHAVHYTSKPCPELGLNHVGLDDRADYLKAKFSDTPPYRADAHAYPVPLMKCLPCGRLTHWVVDACMHCAHPYLNDEREDGGILPVQHQVSADEGLVLSLWATAKNRVQWKGAFDG